jgi:hypothetical protein
MMLLIKRGIFVIEQNLEFLTDDLYVGIYFPQRKIAPTHSAINTQLAF